MSDLDPLGLLRKPLESCKKVPNPFHIFVAELKLVQQMWYRDFSCVPYQHVFTKNKIFYLAKYGNMEHMKNAINS